MEAVTHSFDDPPAYERFMGRWSRSLGQEFLRWLSPSPNLEWLDIGCGTGIVTQMISTTCSPAAVVGIDCAAEQIEHARHFAARPNVQFRVADAQRLPFPNHSFDVVASTLAINFVPDRPRALAEMGRVARPGAVVAGCVWDFAAELSPSWPLRRAMSQMGLEAPRVPGAEDSGLDALAALFRRAGIALVEQTSIEVKVCFESFEELWLSLTPAYAPITKVLARIPPRTRTRLKEIVRTELPNAASGRIAFHARASAASGTVAARAR